MVIFHSYVSLPEGIHCYVQAELNTEYSHYEACCFLFPYLIVGLQAACSKLWVQVIRYGSAALRLSPVRQVMVIQNWSKLDSYILLNIPGNPNCGCLNHQFSHWDDIYNILIYIETWMNWFSISSLSKANMVRGEVDVEVMVRSRHALFKICYNHRISQCLSS
jgi:hypothetical protein